MSEEEWNIIKSLELYQTNMLMLWKNKMIISPQDPLKEIILQNTLAMYDLFIDRIQSSNQNYKKEMTNLGKKIASERLKVNVPISDFLYNISIVRTDILTYLDREFEKSDALNKIKTYMNESVDYLLHETVTHYLTLQEQINDKENAILSETHKERLTLLGQMTSSFVHEFRNPLTSIKGFVQLLKAEHPDLKYLDIISSELEQLNSRISQFLMISKKEDLNSNPEVFSLRYLIDEVIAFLYPSIVDTNVKVETNVEKDTLILGYPEEIRQVLLNIIFNALDVLSNIENPTIAVSINEANNHYVQITIANNGPKINEDLLSDIFKPFITTKKIGTGLGLFVCKEIIEKHNGALTCTSSDSLTVFTILLPELHQDH
ncbi:histidine kinase N-terminal domain-containing protein [Bacillus sp. 1P06AnD]|uniref:histidine kinase N-terminal domain-containing protein n=1 Tax=Bacillus sp. 1P06AnD TaxID=3132208 RepID=UPI0039A19BB9